MSTHRRTFMKTASMFAIGLGMPTVGAKLAAAATGIGQPVAHSGSIDIFKKESFMPHVNSTFRVGSGSSTVDLRLVKINDVRAESKNPRQIRGRENFTLIFEASEKSTELSDNVYNLGHAALGTFPMFLVGIGSVDANKKYEAAVNRL